MKQGWKYISKAIVTAFISLILVCLLPSVGLSSYTYDGETDTTAVTAVESTEPVCYITESSTTNYFMSIESALSYANNSSHSSSSETIYVIPGVTTTISNDCTIASGDTLCLPYSYDSDTGYGSEVYTNGEDFCTSSTGGQRGFSDQILDSIEYYRKTVVILAADKTLTLNGGNLIIGGHTGYYTTGVAGATSQEYCEILMLSNSKILAQNGATITDYGYIREATYIKNSSGTWVLNGSLNNGSYVNVSTDSTFHCPIVVYDFKAGSATAMMVYGGGSATSGTKVCAFEIYDFPNIQSELILNSSNGDTSKFTAEYKFTVNSSAVTGTVTAVDYSGAMVNLTSGTVSIKYTPRLAGLTQGVYGISDANDMHSTNTNGSYTPGTNNERVVYDTSYNYTAESDDDCTYTTFSVDGDAELNKLSLTITIDLSSVSSLLSWLSPDIPVDTSNFDLPLSWRLRFVIGDGTNASTLNVNYAVKMMPGCRVTINQNATATVINKLILFPGFNNYAYEFTDSDGNSCLYWNRRNGNSGETNYYYPTNFGDPYLLNNGTIILSSGSSFGGMVYTTVAGAVFNAESGSVSATSPFGKTYGYEMTDFISGYDDTSTITQSAQGYVDGYGSSYTSTFTPVVYESEGDSNGYYWVSTATVQVVTVSVSLPSVSTNRYRFTFSITYTNSDGDSATGSLEGNTSSTVTGSYAVAKDTTFSVSASRYAGALSTQITATAADGTSQSASASWGGTATLSNLSASQDWTITVESG